jgi:oligopeptide/dipeptide ABC transporter ATP-binding protein
MQNRDLLVVEGFKKYYPVGGGLLSRTRGYVKAVDGVDITVPRGETLGLVGESGCGKSTLGRCILRLEEPTEGKVFFEGKDVSLLGRKSLHLLRRDMQVIFQDPYSSLDPRKTVGQTIGEAFRIHHLLNPQERRDRIRYLMDIVGLSPTHLQRYPHEFSGGQRQRICVSRALALNPKLVIADEPVSALDVSIQAQILNLLISLQNEFHLTYVFISHDLSVVRHISDRVAVMYLGRVVEMAPANELYSRPRHPYTEALLSAVPVANPLRKKERIILSGDVPSPVNPPSGCTFHPRCLYREQICTEEAPTLKEIDSSHSVACHFPRN